MVALAVEVLGEGAARPLRDLAPERAGGAVLGGGVPGEVRVSPVELEDRAGADAVTSGRPVDADLPEVAALALVADLVVDPADQRGAAKQGEALESGGLAGRLVDCADAQSRQPA
jgi:hypothetical protein